MLEIQAVEEAIGELHASLMQNEEARHALEKMANRDGLTGLYNRRTFMEMLEARLAEERRADLIVIGAHGKGAVDRMLFGSSAEGVVRGVFAMTSSVRTDRASTSPSRLTIGPRSRATLRRNGRGLRGSSARLVLRAICR